MKTSKNTVTLIAALLLAGLPAAAGAATPCKQAINSALQKPKFEFKIQSTSLTPLGAEPLVEVTALVLGWYPDSDALSDYYYLVSATCRTTTGSLSNLDDLELYDDMPGEGGVTVKTVTKVRY